GSLPADPVEWKGLLAPIFCSSRQQQESFGDYFDPWVMTLNRTVHPEEVTTILTDMPVSEEVRRSWRLRYPGRTAMLILAGVAILTVLFAIGLSGYIRLPAWPERYVWWCWLGGLVLSVFTWWKIREQILKGAMLSRDKLRGPIDLHQIKLRGEAGLLFGGESLRRAIRLLRRQRTIEARELDLAATIEATIRNDGEVAPVYTSRRATPNYLFLIERNFPGDVQARFGDELAARLIKSHVFVSKFYFSGNLSTIQSVSPDKPLLTLEELASRYSDYRLFIFGDGRQFFSPITGEPYPWLKLLRHWRSGTLLSPEMTTGYREGVLAGYNLRIVPMSERGLGGLPEEVDPDTLVTLDARTQPMPSLILERPWRWIENSPVDEEKTKRLFSQLRSYLGDFGWLWLRACAVFPVISWEITISLGVKLPGRTGRLHGLLLALVRLPWFRHGGIPNWLRLRMIESLEPADETRIREIIKEILTQLDEQGEITLEIARPTPPTLRSLLDRLRENWQRWRSREELAARLSQQPKESPLRDVLMVSFLSGTKTRRLSVGLTDLLRHMLTGGNRRRFGWHTLRQWFDWIKEQRHRVRERSERSIEVQPDEMVIPEFTGTKEAADEARTGAPTVIVASSDRLELPGGVILEMVSLPGGEFTMGGHRFDDEKPRHQVRVSPFAIGKYQVTQAQWKAVMGEYSNPANFKGDNRPVEWVSWRDAVMFIEKLNGLVGGTAFRLPTEAEWEFAARAGSTTEYCYGDDPRQLGDYAWFGDNSDSQTHEVGLKSPNRFGLYDLHGNVWEWCGDWYGSRYYAECHKSGLVIDPIGPDRGSDRVFRGGGWNSGAVYCRSAFRYRSDPGYRDGLLGFRLVRIGR
ncbi:MAG: SUMF1/EgtB/PvdO family nonheme iron enzyme, partial [Acidobacteriota bacterium]